MKQLKFREVQAGHRFKFEENLPVILKVIDWKKVEWQGIENLEYKVILCNETGQAIRETTFVGNKFLNTYLVNYKDKYIRITFLGYTDKDNKKGRRFKLEVAE